MFRRAAARTYATAAKASAQPPVTPPGLAGKYASALFSAATKQSPKALQQVETDLNSLRSLMKSTPQVAAFLSNPTLQTDEKTKGLKDLLGRLGGSTSDLTKNLLSVLAENGRLYDTEKVVEGFEQIMSAHRGELEVTITSAETLDKATIDRIKKSLDSSKVVKEFKSVKVTNKVQPDLLGGLVVDFGADRSIDLSVKARVQKLEGLLAQSL
ncbi:ATP synthase F0 subcomplex subunit OSCP atp5 [Cystobasidiomycetes sp. EMM_F5]